ncbi:MAG: efflux RND transporter periplasmic adaptor subunit [Chitinophagaceae bacterium]|nr:efflux RND transporter periplasmic adaptor subunit [Chitinophagaceae bacterium]
MKPVLTKYFLYTFYLLLASTTFFSCKQKDNTASENAKQEEHAASEVHLTIEQTKAIGLATDTVSFRNLKTTLKANGKLMLPPQNKAQVSVLVGGIVKNILVNEGDFVKKGESLATLENLDFLQLQQDFLENQLQLQLMEEDYRRQKSLQQDNINSSKSLQQAASGYQLAVTKDKILSEKLKVFGINAATLSPGNVKVQFNVTAPISGYIKMIDISIGKFAEPNKVLFDIVDNHFLHIDLTIFEQDIAKVKAGQRLTFSIVNDPHHPHSATIFSTNKAFEDNQQAIIAHAKISEADDDLLPGMFIEARIDVDDYLAMSLPAEAIVSNGNDHFIFVEAEQHTFRQLSVRTGTSDMGFTEIIPLETFSKDEQVVVKGAYYLFSELTKGEGEHHD